MEIRYKIIRAMAELLKTSALDRISVSEICEEAGISRQAFYRRFKDKYDASTWYLDQIVDKTTKRVGISASWKTGYLAFFKAMETNKAFHKRLVESKDINAMTNYSKAGVEQYYNDVYARRYGHEPGQLIAFQIHAVARIDSEVISEWILKGCEPPASEFCDLYLTLIPKELFAAIDMEDVEDEAPLMFVAV